MVEGVISELGLDPDDNRLPADEPAWGLRRGSAEVFISIGPDAGDGDHYIAVVSPLMRLPASEANQTALFRRLLTLNAGDLFGAAFGLRNDTVVLAARRSTTDLDPSEVKTMILAVGYYADLYDDALVGEFGGLLHTHETGSSLP